MVEVSFEKGVEPLAPEYILDVPQPQHALEIRNLSEPIVGIAVFQEAGSIGVAGIVLAIVLSFFIRETGSAVQRKVSPIAPVFGAVR